MNTTLTAAGPPSEARTEGAKRGWIKRRQRYTPEEISNQSRAHRIRMEALERRWAAKDKKGDTR